MNRKPIWPILLVVFCLTTLSGCGVTPWVKPYQRHYLADSLMRFERHPIAGAFTHHVYQSREGARGAEGGETGGCGCN